MICKNPLTITREKYSQSELGNRVVQYQIYLTQPELSLCTGTVPGTDCLLPICRVLPDRLTSACESLRLACVLYM